MQEMQEQDSRRSSPLPGQEHEPLINSTSTTSPVSCLM